MSDAATHAARLEIQTIELKVYGEYSFYNNCYIIIIKKYYIICTTLLGTNI